MTHFCAWLFLEYQVFSEWVTHLLTDTACLPTHPSLNTVCPSSDRKNYSNSVFPLTSWAKRKGGVEEFGGTSSEIRSYCLYFEHVTAKHQKTLILLKIWFLQSWILSKLTLNTNLMQETEQTQILRKETQRISYSSMYLTYTVSHFLTLVSIVHFLLHLTNPQFFDF